MKIKKIKKKTGLDYEASNQKRCLCGFGRNRQNGKDDSRWGGNQKKKKKKKKREKKKREGNVVVNNLVAKLLLDALKNSGVSGREMLKWMGLCLT
jgi:hypothetical protein